MSNKKTTDETGPMEVVRTDSYVSEYSNNVQFLITNWDVQMTFGVIEPVPDVSGTTRIVQKHGIVMSHAHFARMLEVMNDIWERGQEAEN